MEQVMKTFLDSTVTVLNPKYSKKVVCDTLLVNIRVLLCNEVLSNKLKRVLVEAIAPLARVSSGLSQPHELRGMLQPAFERLATISQEKKTEEFNIEEVQVDNLAGLLELMQLMNTNQVPLTPPLTPSDNEEDDFDDDNVFIEPYRSAVAPGKKDCIRYSRTELLALRYHKLPRVKLPALAQYIGIIRDAPVKSGQVSVQRNCKSLSAVSEYSSKSDERYEVWRKGADTKYERFQSQSVDREVKWKHDLFDPSW